MSRTRASAVLAGVLASLFVASTADAFGYPDDIFFTGLRVTAPSWNCRGYVGPPPRGMLLIEQVSADRRSLRVAVRRVVRAQRRELRSHMQRHSPFWPDHISITVEVEDGRARLVGTAGPPGEAFASLERALEQTDWIDVDDGVARVYLHWSVVPTGVWRD